MTMGPAPMIRIDSMSVRLGMEIRLAGLSHRRGAKRARHRRGGKESVGLGGPYRGGRERGEPPWKRECAAGSRLAERLGGAQPHGAPGGVGSTDRAERDGERQRQREV